MCGRVVVLTYQGGGGGGGFLLGLKNLVNISEELTYQRSSSTRKFY